MANICEKESFLDHFNGKNSFLKHLILENCVQGRISRRSAATASSSRAASTAITVTRLGEKAGAIGASYIAKVRMLGIV